MRWPVVLVCSLAGLHAAARPSRAQPATNQPAANQPAANQPAVVAAVAPAAPVEPRSDPAWQLYHDAFAALMQGEPTRARELAGTLLREYPDHPATHLVRGAHLGLAPGAVEVRARGETRETSSRAARAELALFQSLNGIALGIEACFALECDSGEAYFLAALAGGGALTVASLARDELTSGERALLNSGTAWGAVNAGLLIAATDTTDRGVAVGLMVGQAGGIAAGAALSTLHPTAGQVALANSGGEWVGVVGYLTIAATGAHLNNRESALSALVTIDAGIVAGAYLASRFPSVSRAQTLVIDAGGIVGTVGGAGLGILIAGYSDEHTTPALAAVGALAGLGAAAYFTRDWNDNSSTSLSAYVAPTPGGGGIAGITMPW